MGGELSQTIPSTLQPNAMRGTTPFRSASVLSMMSSDGTSASSKRSNSVANRAFDTVSRVPVCGSCWICESWVEVEIQWIPGLSGPMLASEIQHVWAYFSVDNFVQPLKLRKEEEH